jgi:hypothetical protein
MSFFSRSPFTSVKPHKPEPAFAKENLDMIREDLDFLESASVESVSIDDMLIALVEFDYVSDSLKGYNTIVTKADYYKTLFKDKPEEYELDLKQIIDLIRTDLDFIEASNTDDVIDTTPESMLNTISAMDGDGSPLKAPPGYCCDDITIEYSISIDQSLQLFMHVFAPVMMVLFAYEFSKIWKQFKLNRQAQYVSLPTDSKTESAGKMSYVRKPITLKACVLAFSFLCFAALMVFLHTLLQ